MDGGFLIHMGAIKIYVKSGDGMKVRHWKIRRGKRAAIKLLKNYLGVLLYTNR